MQIFVKRLISLRTSLAVRLTRLTGYLKMELQRPFLQKLPKTATIKVVNINLPKIRSRQSSLNTLRVEKGRTYITDLASE